MFIAIGKSDNIISYLGCHEDCNLLHSKLEEKFGILRQTPGWKSDKGYLIKMLIYNDDIEIYMINTDMLTSTVLWDLFEE